MHFHNFDSSSSSYWASGQDEGQKSALHAFALDVFDHCTRGFPEELKQHAESGAEYWVQVRHGSAEEREIQWHADKDEQKFSDSGVCVTPTLATVTYLTSGGAPTIVVDSAASAEGVLENNGQRTALGCVPKIGRQLRFNGSFASWSPKRTCTRAADCRSSNTFSQRVARSQTESVRLRN